MEEQSQDQEYFEKRSLKSGAAGWVLLTGLGVAYVVSGDFSGWNYGIAYGGWLGLAIAFLAMGCMYACTVFGIAELSSAIPTAGAGYGFARRAFGRFGGFMTGLAVLIEYVCAPAAISTFIANYLDAIGLVSGDGGHLLAVAVCYALFIAVHIIGVGEALKTMLVITVVAVVALVVFIVGALPGFDFSRLFDIAPAAGGSALLPYGVAGVLAALPFGIWFFLGIEGVPLGSEEARDPRKDVPRAIIGAMAILVLTGMAVLFLAAGNTGAAFMGQSTAPLVDVLERAGQPALGLFVNVAGLFGLVASFFSLIYAGSRQMFALSRAGYLPDRLAVTGKRKTPALALIVIGAVGFVLVVVVRNGDALIDMAVFGACVSYAMMNLSHIVLRRREPQMRRGYRTPGGTVTTWIGFILSCVAIVSTFVTYTPSAIAALAVLAAGAIYFAAYARHRLVGNAPEEEFARIEAA